MGLTDFVSRVLTEYKADTSDHKAKLKELKGEERKQHEERLKQIEAQNAKVQSQIDTIEKWSVRLGIAAAAGAVAWKGLETAARKADLQTQAAGVSIERLAKASGGLRSQMDLLEQTARLQNGAFKLTAEQMDMVMRAQRQLVREGHAQEEVTKKVTDALVKLEADGLKDFGIRTREAKTDGEKFAAVLDALAGKSSELNDEQLTTAERLQKTKANLKDATDSFMVGVGKLAQSLIPLLDSLTRIVGIIGKINEATGGAAGAILLGARLGGLPGAIAGGAFAAQDVFGSAVTPVRQATDLVKERNASASAISIALSSNESIGPRASGSRDFGVALGLLGMVRNEVALQIEKAAELQAQQAKQPGGTGRASAPDLRAMFGDVGVGGTMFGAGGAGSLGAAASVPGLPDVDLQAIERSRFGDLLADYERFRSQKQQSFLEGAFGPLSDFNAYATAFQTLSGAVGASLTAWIDGSASAGEAFKRFISDALKGLAAQMAMESLKHGAYALGSLAFGDVRGAAQHGKAAFAFGIAAGAAAVASKGLHSGPAVPSVSAGGSGASAGGAGAIGSSGGQGGGTNVTVVMGDSFADDSPRNRQLRAERLVRRVVGSSGVVYE